jgi:rhodanese-related sulfurtransferase
VRQRIKQRNSATAKARSLIYAALSVLVWAWLLGFSAVATEASHGREEINYIGPDRVKALLDGGEKILFIDVSPAKNHQEKRIPGSRSIPFAEFEKRMSEVPRGGRIVIYCNCKAGGDDTEAFFLLRDDGYRNVAVMEEGFAGWVRRKFPTEEGRR